MSSGTGSLYLDGVLVDTDTTTLATLTPTFEIGSRGGANPFDGTLGGVRADSTARTAAEINLDYLLQGPNAATYWTVTDLTTLPEPTFELRSDRDVVLSGSSVTSWGNASGGTSPTFSNEAADRILGFPAIQFDRSSLQYLRWDEIASMFSGDDPDYTFAVLLRLASASTQRVLAAGNNGSGNALHSIISTPSIFASRQDDVPTNDVGGLTSIGTSDPHLVIFKSEGGVSSVLSRNLTTGAETSSSSTMNSPGSVTMLYGAIGDSYNGSAGGANFDGDIARIRLYNEALGGDLTDLADGTQLALLRDEMLREAGDNTLLQRHHYFLGLGMGIGLS